MKPNMGNADRVVRIVTAITISAFYILNVITGVAAYILLALAGIFLVTGIVGKCPVYSIFGMNTRNVDKPGKFQH